MIDFRKATRDDLHLYYEWVNDKDVRANALNPEPIAWENHYQWYQNKLADSNTFLFVFEQDNIPVGQVRIDCREGFGYIDYSVDRNFRGKGYGKSMLGLVINYLQKDGREKVLYLKAVVKTQNIASVTVFKNLHFLQYGIENIQNNECIIFLYMLNKDGQSHIS
ncbi:GNAT family N-acetyltransferase [Rhodocytophaga rosea]|uniref:GNAT family N-acetyltransferase n=1 Tax=Rhodocytophaga rosea TaxID=2704465 RepID=A0A6C0GLB5_9BACT|nr:GNAT family N-acetyltransferase [Rhodocytophaga rosea]QHT68826.1 GNAT family N-acetyltransferase [Rhodocytophaga rosea]